MVKVTKEGLEQIKDNLKCGSWISWKKFKKLNQGDKITIPSYNSDSELIGYETITISNVSTYTANYEDMPGLTMGQISGKYILEYIDKNKNSVEGGMCGVISVCTDEIEGFDLENPNTNLYNEIYSSFNDMISKWIKENNIEPSELNYETMKQVVEDYGESWYRLSLGKIRFH